MDCFELIGRKSRCHNGHHPRSLPSLFLSRNMKIPGNPNDITAQAIGYIGMLAAFCMFLSPIPTMQRILKEKSVSDFSEVPYIVATMNCAIWACYCLSTTGRTQPLITNSIGLFFEIIYSAFFLTYSRNIGPTELLLHDITSNSRIKKRLFIVWSSIFIIAFFSYAIIPMFKISGFLANGDSAVTDILGILASTFNTLMYGSPLSVMFQVIQTQSVEFMPLPLTVMTSFSCLTWGLYAFYVGDIFIGIPNYIGIFLCMLQYILYATYYSSTPSSLNLNSSKKVSIHSAHSVNSVSSALHTRLTNHEEEEEEEGDGCYIDEPASLPDHAESAMNEDPTAVLTTQAPPIGRTSEHRAKIK